MIADDGFCACKAPPDSALRPTVRVGAKYTRRIIRSTPLANDFVAGPKNYRNQHFIDTFHASGQADPAPARELQGRPAHVDARNSPHEIELDALDPTHR